MIEYVQSEPSSQTPRNMKGKNMPRQQKTLTNAKSRSKLALLRSKSKQNFLTDPQTSDHTQKSSSSTKLKFQILEQKLNRFNKQNLELRQQIITMKANQFYTINEEKVKSAIQENQKLKQEILDLKNLNQELQIQNQFLQRNNKYLKDKLQELTETNLRKSVDISKSRTRQNTARTIAKGQFHLTNTINKEILKQNNTIQEQSTNPLQYSSKKYQKRTLDHVKSNPNLVSCQTDFTEVLSQQYPKCRQKQFPRKKFIDPLQKSDQHFLKQFEKYQKQLSYRSGNMYDSRGQMQSRQELNQKRVDKTSQRNQNLFQPAQSRGKRSKSKQNSLQGILMRKKEISNQKQKLRRDEINRYRDQNDQNDQDKGNRGRNDNFNQEYLIGKSTKQSKGNYLTNSPSTQRFNQQNPKLRGYYRN